MYVSHWPSPSSWKIYWHRASQPAADAAVQDATATKDDIARIIQSIELRDQRIVKAEAELRRVTEEYRKLRDELLPVFRMVKDKSHPLPYHPTGPISESQNYDQNAAPPPTSQQEKFAGLGRKLTNPGKLFLGLAPKNNSPTHIPPSATDNKSFTDNANLDPSNAAVAAQNHLAASINGGSQPSTSPHQQSIPSPTSPPSYNSQQPTLGSKSYRDQAAPRQMFPHAEEPQYAYNNMNDRDRGNPTPTPRIQQRSEEPPSSGGGSTGVSNTAQNVEIFKSFRVSMDDPCHKVLPAALRKYNINADWRQYALYIVYGDQERCLGLDERPLILFKQLDREGKKPMFMLRKHAAPVEGHSGTVSNQPGSAGLENGQGTVNMGRGQQYQNGIQLPQLPGGVLWEPRKNEYGLGGNARFWDNHLRSHISAAPSLGICGRFTYIDEVWISCSGRTMLLLHFFEIQQRLVHFHVVTNLLRI